MLAIPSVNLRDGKVVLLAGGDARHEALRFDDARQVARHWVRTGFRRLHCVDIDAATGHGHNLPTVRALLDEQVAAYQMGGGVRTRERIDELRNEGAEWVVIGTRALDDPDWLATIVSDHPGHVMVAVDVRERRVVTKGWERQTTHHILDVVEELAGLPLAGAVLGAALYSGVLDARLVAEEFAE